MPIDIDLLVDCAGTAYWRREKAVKFPDDPRNLEAARELDRLAAEITAQFSTPGRRRPSGKPSCSVDR
jgi:hypothetical protein